MSLKIIIFFFASLSLGYCKQGGETQVIKKDSMGAMEHSPSPSAMATCYPSQVTPKPTMTPMNGNMGNMQLNKDDTALTDMGMTPTPSPTYFNPCPTYPNSTPTPR